MQKYLTVFEKCAFEFVEKKSRFTGTLFHIESAEEAQEIIAAVKKEFWDASHNCSAYILGETKNIMRFSDDGEPQGTAGMPMLEALKQSGLTDVLCIATRYFGGVLLGAGGLVRAYTKCVAGAVAKAKETGIFCELVPSYVYKVVLPYSQYGKLENLASGGLFKKEDALFEDNVTAFLSIPTEREQAFLKEMSEAFMGTVVPEKTEEKYIKNFLK